MAISRSTLSLAGITFLAGAIVMMFFIVLAGVSDANPLNKTYFLSADTSSITDARDRSQWTYFYICSPGNVDCSGAWPAPAFGWAWSQDAANAPSELAGSAGNNTTNHYYYLMWRFGWVFFLLGLFFAVMAWFSSFLACCGRLGAGLAGLSSAVALLFYTVAVALITTTFVKARNAFLADDKDAQLGTYAFGFMWGAWAAIFIATVLFCIGTRTQRSAAGGGKRWGRTRSVRSELGGRRVKEDYA
ncbi:actin cortical patch SUR7/pH-response regulator pali [Pseudomassariella vexata]|uniref:Actin cortical patch SUR7/pH-response regulator pali n=1 Tax=Pseudomassariella vexata TaxID=1141098 RepID=A0A1Y2E8W4_9PEZI|nr:actin cortical patch SUR7/pH-response regulator pali [Pseudomassariella vexata]ORY67754.1 actin cortical patch SUR7/pH-response regulator pali [Pseudomassariella vexata]